MDESKTDKRRRTGPPPVRLYLRLTREQHAAIKAYAEREGRSLNNAIAHAVDGLTGRTA